MKSFLRLAFLFTFTSLSSILKSQGVEPDSQYRLVPIPTLECSNLVGKPLATVGDVIVFKDDRNDPKKVHDINGKAITFGMFSVNVKTGKFMFVDNINDLGYLVFQSKRTRNSNVFYMISFSNTKIYKVTFGQDTIIANVIYVTNGSARINYVTEYLDDLVIGEVYHGITILNPDYTLKKFIKYSVEYSSLAKYGELIVFGGYSFGVIFSANVQTGEIIDIRGNTGTINGAYVTVIDSQLYADVDGELYKKNKVGEDWTKIVSAINPQTLKYNAILGEYTLRTKVGEDYIFRNDSLVNIPVSPYENLIYLDSYTHTLYKKYGNIGHSAWYIFPLKGKIYGVGDGMVGTVEKVLIPGEDTLEVNIPYLRRHLQISPNPARDKVFISGLQKETSVKIYNLMGQIGLNQWSKGVIDISELEQGIYVVEVEGFQPKKIIIQ